MKDVNLDDLPADIQRQVLKQAGARRPRKQGMSADDVRGWAFRILALLAPLSSVERSRVIRHASKLNNIKVRGS